MASLVEAGTLLPAAVEGWLRPAYLNRDMRISRHIEAQALLAPFDPLIKAAFGYGRLIQTAVVNDKLILLAESALASAATSSRSADDIKDASTQRGATRELQHRHVRLSMQ